MPRTPILLLVEDDPDDAFFTRQALAELCPDALLLVVEDGQAAIDYLSGAEPYGDRGRFPLPDHMILDLKLPRRTGLDVLRWLQGRPELSGLAVTMLSGSQLSNDIAEACALGARDFITKPVDYSGFLGVMREFCRKLGLADRSS